MVSINLMLKMISIFILTIRTTKETGGRGDGGTGRRGSASPFDFAQGKLTGRGDGGTGGWGDGETRFGFALRLRSGQAHRTGRRGDGEMGRWGDGETGRWGNSRFRTSPHQLSRHRSPVGGGRWQFHQVGEPGPYQKTKWLRRSGPAETDSDRARSKPSAFSV